MRNPKPSTSGTGRKSYKIPKTTQTAPKTKPNISKSTSHGSHGDSSDSDSIDFLSRPGPILNPSETQSSSNQSEHSRNTSSVSGLHDDSDSDSIDFLSRPGLIFNPSETQSSSNQSEHSQNTSSIQSPSVSGSSRVTVQNTTQQTQKTAPTTKGPRKQPAPKKKKRKDRVLREVMRLQSTTTNLIPKAPFHRVVREIMMYLRDGDWRITPEALGALQESAEVYITQMFEDSYLCTIHRGRITLQANDMQLVKYLRGPSDPGNC